MRISILTNELQSCVKTKLNETQGRKHCWTEGLLQYQGVAQCLKNMIDDDRPGIDGFSNNLYKVFWGKIGHFCALVDLVKVCIYY